MINRREMMAISAGSAAGILFGGTISEAKTSTVPSTEGKRDAHELLKEILKEKIDIFRKTEFFDVPRTWPYLSWEFLVEFAAIGDNQRCWSQVKTSKWLTPYYSTQGQCELVRRILQHSALPQLVSVQTMLKPSFPAFYHHPNGELDYEVLAAGTKKSKLQLAGTAKLDRFKDQCNLDAKEEYLAIVAQELALEMDREVIHDLCVNADNYKIPWDNLSQGIAFCVFQTQTARIWDSETLSPSSQWMIVSPEIADFLKKRKLVDYPGFFTSSLAIHSIGYMTGTAFQVFVDPLFPTNRILFGQKQSHAGPHTPLTSNLAAGYVYAPYIMFTLAPLKLNGDHSVLLRYGKRLINKDYYTLMELV